MIRCRCKRRGFTERSVIRDSSLLTVVGDPTTPTFPDPPFAAQTKVTFVTVNVDSESTGECEMGGDLCRVGCREEAHQGIVEDSQGRRRGCGCCRVGGRIGYGREAEPG